MASPIICEVRNLSVPPLVRGEVSFTLREGDRLCVYGHSASGKSTLLRALLGLIPYRGEVIWHVPRVSIGYAGQRPRLIPRATVLQQSCGAHNYTASTFPRTEVVFTSCWSNGGFRQSVGRQCIASPLASR
ncbi:MAG: ATP-binding cassette domain-containing protein [Armatimonadota bacterium]